MKTIKIANGVRLTTDEGTKECADMTVFDVVKCTDEQRIEIIRNLMAFHKIDFTPIIGRLLVMELY